ncbi:MAG: type II secretion system secretin GspD [Nitrospirae bacterium]|nr:type II secretion system secretin GspD [Nitrospirota bacterium]
MLMFFLLASLLLINFNSLHAQMNPPPPPVNDEGQTTGSEGTILPESEGTFQTQPLTLPRVIAPRSQSPAATPGSPAAAGANNPANLRNPLFFRGRDTGTTTTVSEAEKTGAEEIQPPSNPPQIPSGRQTAAKGSERMVTLDFNNVDLQTFVKFISELTGKNFVLDEKVQGKVTVISPTKISVDDAYKVFLTVLELKGFTAVGENKVIKIFPSREAKQSGVSIVTEERPLPDYENYETRVLRLNYISATEISRLIAPLVSKDGSSIPYSQTNTLILTDVKSNMNKLLNLIGELDKEPQKGKGGIYVHYLQNAGAEDMAKVLASLTSKSGARPAAGQASPDATVLFEGGISITADKATNSLIIMASPEDYERLKSIIERLDIRRKQVYVEAAIVEMSVDKARELGVEFRTTENLTANETIVAGGTLLAPPGAGLSSFAVNPLSVNGLVAAGIKGFLPDGTTPNIGALVRLFQSDSNINVLSTPNILTLDNQEAKIIVGQNVPFITGVSQTTGGNVQASIERKDVGIQLKITPHTTESDLVKLDIYQEISSLAGSVPVGTDQEVPITSKRSAETSVVVRDQETIVIAGLIKDDVTVTERKVPFLGDIPILGYLFKYENRKKVKTNLMLFITPYIIRDAEKLEELSRDKRRDGEAFRKKNKFQLKDSFILNPPK